MKLVSWTAGLAAGCATALLLFVIARKKGFLVVAAHGEGGFLYFVMALGALLVGGGTYRAVAQVFARRAKLKAESERIPPARVV